MEPLYLREARNLSKILPEPIPKLCTLVTASPFDAAIHDAFGKLHGRNCYRTYGKDLMPRDLGQYLGPAFKGEYLSRYVLDHAQPTVPLYHSVGARDPIFASDVRKKLNDGLPQTLPEWIRYNGLTHLKIKLNGGALETDSGAGGTHSSSGNGDQEPTMVLLPRLQRGLSECRVPARVSAQVIRARARCART